MQTEKLINADTSKDFHHGGHGGHRETSEEGNLFFDIENKNNLRFPSVSSVTSVIKAVLSDLQTQTRTALSDSMRIP